MSNEMEITKEARTVEFKEYYRVYECKDHPGSGFHFPSDELGNAQVDQLAPIAKENLRFCIKEAGRQVIDKGVQINSWSVREPAEGTCACGWTVYLSGDDMGEVDCPNPNCNRVYNVFGQELNGHTHAWSGMNDYGEYYDEY